MKRKQYCFRASQRGLLAWDVHRLIALTADLPSKHIPLSDIREFDGMFWCSNEGDSPTCQNIALHARLISETDLRHPIILSSDGRVMDGMHRACKALNLGHETILVAQLVHDPEPDFIGVSPDDLPYS